MSESGTILVVDDDQELREGLETLLQQHGYRTRGAEDGLDARQLIDEEKFDLVVLDMMMPRWGGFALLEHYQGKTGSPPFLMMTAHPGEKHKAYAEQIGVVGYLRKPFAVERLLDGVNKVLHRPARVEAQERPAIRVRCGSCGARIKAPVQMLGQTRPCPGCKLPLVVRPEPPEDQGPILV